jgi:non-specific serine/threonine protein kinase/serine/threonine-protein kinase
VALIALALIAGLVGTTWQARVAQRERIASDRRFKEARELARYLVFDLQTSVGALPGSTPVRAEMVSRSLAYLDRLAAERSNDESLSVELARGYLQLADVLGHPFGPNIGEPVRAQETYRKAIAILEPIAAKSPDSREARLLLARGRLMLGRSIGFNTGSAEARQLVQSATEEFGRLTARWPDDFDVRSQAGVAVELATTASVLLEPERYSLGDAKLALAIAQCASQMNGKDAEIKQTLAKAYWFSGDGALAVEAMKQSLPLIGLNATQASLREQTPQVPDGKAEQTIRK